MCEQTEISYLDGEVVWVKLGSCWWPGEVVAPEKLPPDVLPSFRKPPIAVVKFFQEDTYEYVKNINSIYKYNCSRKNEFINKGLYMYRTKHGPMEKFPEDVIRAETAVGGDIEILTRDEFQEMKKESYAGLFGDSKKTPSSAKRGRGRGRPAESPRAFTPVRKVREKTDYKVHILVQGSTTPVIKAPETQSTPSTSRADSEPAEDKHKNVDMSNESPQTPENPPDAEKPVSAFSTPTVSSSGMYSCHACSFSTTRLNVLILHNKSHSVSFTPYTPSPAKKKVTKPSVKSTPSSSKTPKTPRPRKEKTEKSQKKPSPGEKRPSEHLKSCDVKKAKTEQDFKKTLLADWDDADEDSHDESPARAGSPEVAVAAESPAVPTPAELPSAQIPGEMASFVEKKPEHSPSSNEKPESSSDSKYEFCEDEDWPVEAGVGRKIPRVKNPSKRKDETKSLSLDDDDMAREVAELLTKTAVPELPSVPEPLKVEENFPEPSVAKSPDKQEMKATEPKLLEKVSEGLPSKAIFKTKTFFRSRHSRSQDAIGKYVAEQLNAVERMDMSETEINGSDALSSPEARESPPIEPIKVARLAPKIQLKKMKAEAAQLREKEKNDIELLRDDASTPNIQSASPISENISTTTDKSDSESLKENDNVTATPNLLQDVLYPTQEIKPINEQIIEGIKTPVSIEETLPTLDTNTSLDTDVAQNKIAIEIKDLSEPEIAPVIKDPKIELVIKEPEIEHVIEEPEIETVIKESETEPVIETPETEPVIETPETEPVIEGSEKEPVIETPETEFVVEDSEMGPIVTEPETELVIKESEINVNELVVTPSKHQEPTEKLPEKVLKPYMNESTASAVDALLSVSRDADRVTRVVSDDPPEDLFEDDNKEIGTGNTNGFNEVINEESVNKTANVENTNDLINEESVAGNGIDLEQKETYGRESLQENGRFENTNVANYGDGKKLVTAGDNINKELSTEDEPMICEYPSEVVVENVPSESDLQIAEALINLPATAIQNKNSEIQNIDLQETVNINMDTESTIEIESVQPEIMEIDTEVYEPKEEIKSFEKEHMAETVINQSNENVNARFETELEKNENLNAAQSLVQMSESIDHNINMIDAKNKLLKKDTPETEAFTVKKNNGVENSITVEQKVASLSKDNSNEPAKPAKYETTSSKLLKILEEPCAPKFPKKTPIKQIILPGKEKILNFDVAKSSFKSKSQAPVIIRRAATNKNIINNLNDMGTAEKIILSRSNKPTQDGSSVQTYTIQTSPDAPSDANTITIIQQKVRKIQKPPNKLQKIKPQTSLITPVNESKTNRETTITEDTMFDINSMPIVLSDDILTPESIEKMPIVMSDGNLITNTANPPKLVKTKQQIIESDKSTITHSTVASKPEIKTLLMNPVSEVNKVATPNILSKSSKLRGAKPMLVIDKATGKQKIIMTKAEPSVKEIKPAPTLIQSVPQNTGKADKFLILPTTSSPRQGRTQKIVIDPQTGKAHVLVAKGPDTSLNLNDNKPVSAKLIPSSSDAASPGNTVMIITNAQGAQSRIVLTSEHEKILFPNKQQPNMSQLKTIAHKISTTSSVNPQKSLVSSVSHVKAPTRIVPKQQKSAIITSKGQLIVGGRVATTAQNIVPMPEIRPAQRRIVAAEPKKLVQTIQKTNAEPLIFLQQKSGTVVQLTASQFEHFQRTGQIIQKIPLPAQEKPIVQKTITVSPAEPVVNVVQKPRVRKIVTESPTPAKRVKQEIAIAPAHPPITPMPALTPLTNTVVTTVVPSLLNTIVPSISNTVSVTTSTTYPDLDNFEEMLPSTAIARQPEAGIPAAAPPEPAAPALADGQLLAVPGEHFGGPPGSFYLCVEDSGTLTPIDNRPLVLENNQLVPMAVEPLPILAPQPERRDILEAALANSDVFHAEPPRDEAPDFRDLNANVSVHCRVSETSTTLNQPIMTPVEVPSKGDTEPATVPSNLEDGLAVIGVTPHTVPTSLELPITVTDPRIAPKTADPLRGTNYGPTLLTSPNTEMTYITTEEVDVPMCGPISMPLLTDEESIGKSMPSLTDEVAVSSVESGPGSPAGEADEADEAGEAGEADEAWPRRLLTPGSDTSETSSEIPLQPSIQLSVNEMSRLS